RLRGMPWRPDLGHSTRAALPAFGETRNPAPAGRCDPLLAREPQHLQVEDRHPEPLARAFSESRRTSVWKVIAVSPTRTSSRELREIAKDRDSSGTRSHRQR